MLTIADVLDANRDFAIGAQDRDEVIDQWTHGAGFTAEQVRDWIEVARCFDAAAAHELASVYGVTPAQASGHWIYDSIGYAVSNGDTTAAHVADYLERVGGAA